MINKRALAAAVDAMEARNTSNWAKGLEFAYRAFIDVSGLGTGCGKMEMGDLSRAFLEKSSDGYQRYGFGSSVG